MSPSTCLQGGARQPLENTISSKSGRVQICSGSDYHSKTGVELIMVEQNKNDHGTGISTIISVCTIHNYNEMIQQNNINCFKLAVGLSTCC